MGNERPGNNDDYEDVPARKSTTVSNGLNRREKGLPMIQAMTVRSLAMVQIGHQRGGTEVKTHGMTNSASCCEEREIMFTLLRQ